MRPWILVLLGLAAVMAGFFWVNRPQLVRIPGALPDGFPDDGFSHGTFEQLLARYVDADGNVDYDRWHAATDDVLALQSYLAAVSRFSPDNAPERFPTRASTLAYWLYAYNSYVIYGVLSHWPIGSVMELKAPVEIVKGLGFFYRTRYLFGERPLSLYAVENNIIRRQYRDPRIHFVLNCGSESCPVLRPELPTGAELEELLAHSARRFVAERRNVDIDHDNRVVWLSDIFRMYRSDFVNHLRAVGRPVDGGVLAYIAGVAPGALRADIERARDYDVRFRDFDWRVNASKEATD